MLPAEAGLDERAVSFEKGCYPGQEPIARQRYRGKVNRRLRVLEIDGPAAEAETPVVYGEKEVGRVTSAVPASRSPTFASRCPTTPSCESGRQRRGYTDRSLAPVAQGIERCPAEAEVARSNLAGRIAWFGLASVGCRDCGACSS